MCAHRGLVPGTTDQTFIVSLTQTFKHFYDELMKQKDNVRLIFFAEEKLLISNNIPSIFVKSYDKIEKLEYLQETIHL